MNFVKKPWVYLILNAALTYVLFWVMVWALLYFFDEKPTWYIPHFTLMVLMFLATATYSYLLIKLLKVAGKFTLSIAIIEIALFYTGYWYVFGLHKL